jgi:hypothetical protein
MFSFSVHPRNLLIVPTEMLSIPKERCSSFRRYERGVEYHMGGSLKCPTLLADARRSYICENTDTF